MKKVIAVLAVLLLGATFTVAAPVANKAILSKIIKGKVVTLYEDIKLSVPQGQTILVGLRENGSLLIRGQNLDRVQIENTYISTDGYSVISYQPNSQVVFLNRGNSMTVTDPLGHTSTVAQNGAISTINVAVTSDTVAEMKVAAEKEAQEAAIELAEEISTVPAFVLENTLTNAGAEQAAQDVEDTLSPSAPR